MSGLDAVEWGVIENETADGNVHVIPLGILTHVETRECWCGPRVEHHDRDLVIHCPHTGESEN